MVKPPSDETSMLRHELRIRHQMMNAGPSSSSTAAATYATAMPPSGRLPCGVDRYPGQPPPAVQAPLPVDLEELEPMSRNRCNTWPLRRPELDITAQTSPLIHEEIPEEDNVYDSSENINGHLNGSQLGGGLMGSPDERNGFSPGMCSPIAGSGNVGSAGSDTSDPGVPGSGNKKSSTRRNAWGNMSYADLITQAINSSPEKRLTLSQVYEWMVQNVPYFRDKGDSNSSAGWKNSIRHNLSLHSRFMRIQNEGAGKSSWWVINPDAKPGRNPRRQRSHTMETTTKASIDKKRRGARKKILELQQRGGGALHSNGSSVVGSQVSLASHDLYPNEEDPMGYSEQVFRGRADSNLSVPGSISRVSPTMDRFDESLDFPAWVEAEAYTNIPVPSDILVNTSNIQLDPAGGRGMTTNPGSSPYRRQQPITSQLLNNDMGSVLNGATSPSQTPMLSGGHIKAEPLDAKDSKDGVQPPPSYQELRTVPMRCQGTPQMQQNPLLINQMQPQQGHLVNHHQSKIIQPHHSMQQVPHQYYSSSNGVSYAMPAVTSVGGPGGTIQHWAMPSGPIAATHQPVSCGAQQFGNSLPNDLANLTFEQPLMEMDMMDAVLRHELSQNSTLSFDNI